MNTTTRSAGRILAGAIGAFLLAWLLAACGGGGGSAVETKVLLGQVIGGFPEGARVCLDLNASGRCDETEPQARTDPSGAYSLRVDKAASAPLVAESANAVMGETKPGTLRFASPSPEYATDLTAFTTLVHLTHVKDFALAEDLVRGALGLPPHFAIGLHAPPAAGSLAERVASATTEALCSCGASLAANDEAAFGKVVAALPPRLADLPVLRIQTKDGAPIVSREVYVDATFTLLNPAVSPEAMPLNGKIRGRGHSTWGLPKNPYKVQFKEDAAYAAVPDFLGMRKNRNWALLADWYDRSLMRNKLAFSLGNSVAFSDGLKWTPSGQHLEVYLNGDYVGVYLLAEDIRIAPERLDIRKMAKTDTDGGYIVEVDMRLDCYNDGTLNLQHLTPLRVPVCIDTPDEGSITTAQLAYIKGLVDSAEGDIYGGASLARLNPASFADWYLLSELFRNNDAVFFASDFMWKDTNSAANPADRLLNMGPIWDFDLSAGNYNFNDNWKSEGCWVNKTPPGVTTNWFGRLFDNRAFLDLTIARWKAKRPLIGTFVNASLDAWSVRLAAPQQRNFQRWPILGTQWTNYYTFATWEEEVAFLRVFLNERMAWMDRAFDSPESWQAMCR